MDILITMQNSVNTLDKLRNAAGKNVVRYIEVGDQTVSVSKISMQSSF